MSDLPQKLEKLNIAVRDLAKATDRQELLENILDVVEKVFGRETAALLMLEPDGEHLSIVASRGYDPDVVLNYRAKVGEGVAGSVAQTRKARLVSDVSAELDYVRGVSDAVSEMAVPLVVNGSVLGVLDIESSQTAFNEDDVAILTAFGEHAGWALRHNLALSQANERARRMDLLNKASGALNSIHDTEELLSRILELAKRALGLDSTAILLPDGPGEHLIVRKAVGRKDVEGLSIPPGKGIVGTVFSTGDAEIVNDVLEDDRYIPGGMQGAKSEMVVPIALKEEIIGVLDAESSSPYAFEELDLEVFSGFASHVATALANASYISNLDDRSRRLALLNRAARALNTCHDPEELLERILNLAREALGFDSIAILLPEKKGHHLIVRKAKGREGVEGLSIPPGQGISGTVMETGKAELIGDTSQDERYIPGGMEGGRSEMVAPIDLNGDIIGVLDAESRRIDAFNQMDLEVFTAFAAQVATALSNANLVRSLDNRTRRLEILNKAARAINTLHEPETVLDRILELADDALGFDSVAVLVADVKQGQLEVTRARGRQGVVGMKIPVDQGIVGTVFKTGQAEIIDDVSMDPRYIDGGKAGERSEIVAPLNLNGEILGVLDAEHDGTDAFSEVDMHVFSAFAAQVATALRNARLLEEIERKAKRLKLITDAGRALNTILVSDELIDEILKSADEALGLGRAALLLLDRDNNELVVHAARGYGEVIGKRIPLGEGITGVVAMNGTPEFVNDVESNGRYVQGSQGARSEMAFPLRVYGEIIGILDTESTEPDAYTENDLELFGVFADQAAVAIHNARLFKRLEEANESLKNNLEEMNRLNNELEAYAQQIVAANVELEVQIKQLKTLHSAGQAITSSLDLDHTLGAILKMTSDIVESSAGAIKLIDEETKELKTRAKAGITQEDSGQYLKYDLPLKVGEKTVGVFELIRDATEEMDDGEKQMLETLASQAAIAIENARLFEDTQRIYYETLKSLAKALEARDDYTRGHSERVAQLSLEIAHEMKLEEAECNIIFNSALLHDIGKIGVRDAVLLKPRKLTSDEMEIIKKHPTYSNTILGPLKFLGRVSELVKYHHERWDGSGYPMGLKGMDIPLPSRIIGVADAFDAMTSTRPYRKAMSDEDALKEIKKQCDVQFDPDVVKAFFRVIESRTAQVED